MTALCYEVGADAYLCVNTTTTRTLLWAAARAIERHELMRDNRRLLQADRQRLHQEHLEADRLLAQQRALISDLESLTFEKELESNPGSKAQTLPATSGEASSSPTTKQNAPAPSRLPAKLVAHYRELLRAYVIMGSGNLNGRHAGALRAVGQHRHHTPANHAPAPASARRARCAGWATAVPATS